MPNTPKNLIQRLTEVDNRLRGRLPAQLGIPTIKLVRWTLDGVMTPLLPCRVTSIGAPNNKAYLDAAVNTNLVVSEETLLIKDIPRQVNGVSISTNILNYGIVTISALDMPELVTDTCEVLFLDTTSKITTYTATVKPLRNR